MGRKQRTFKEKEVTINTPTVLAPAGTRLRAEWNGKTIADSRNVLIFRESPFKIYYYFPEEEVESDLIDRSTAKTSKRKNGELTSWALVEGAKRADEAAFAYTVPQDGFDALRGRIGLSFEAMDRWLEEDEELLGHPRDPFTRIDVRRTSLHVEVIVEGTTVIDSRHPFVLTETGLAIRYYIPSADVAWEHFTESNTESVCPYKGRARYWSAVVDGKEHPDVIWQYPKPLQDAVPIRDTVGLYHERLDVLVDGERVASWPSFFTK